MTTIARLSVAHSPNPTLYEDERWKVERMAPFGVAVTAKVYTTDVMRFPADELARLARRHGIALLRGFQTFTTPEETEHFANRLGDPLTGRYGHSVEYVENPGLRKTANSPLFRWDGMFSSELPAFQVSYCVTTPGLTDQGGITYVDTTRVAADAEPELLTAWKAVTITYVGRGTGGNAGWNESPLVVPHPVLGTPTLRYSEPGSIGESSVEHTRRRMAGGCDADVDRVLDTLTEMLNDPARHYRHTWHCGDILIADNYTLLHRREPFPCSPSRRVRQVSVRAGRLPRGVGREGPRRAPTLSPAARDDARLAKIAGSVHM